MVSVRKVDYFTRKKCEHAFIRFKNRNLGKPKLSIFLINPLFGGFQH